MTLGPVGLAVFGAGRIGAVHARNVARAVPGASLVGIADVNRAAAKRLADEIGAGRVDDRDALLNDPMVHGIIVATTTETHAELVTLAAAAKKHVFCEKPIALQISTTRTVVAKARQAGIILQVGFQRRFDAEFLKAHRLLQNGEIGQPRFARFVARDHRIGSFEYLRTSGGQYRDQMIHEFDAVRWLLAPRTVKEIYATGSALIEPRLSELGDVDTAVALLRFDDNVIAMIDTSREAAYGYDIRAEIQGSKGMVLIGQQRLAHNVLFDARNATPDVDSFIERFADAYRAEIIDFVSAIREGRQARVTGEDALDALRIAVAADRSLHSGRPTSLSDVADD